MEKTEARKVICRYAHRCRNRYGMTQDDWNSLWCDISIIKPEEVMDAQDLVPEIWEHVGYWVWQPMRRDR